MFDFVHPSAPPRDHPAYDALAIALAAPTPYVARDALTRHLDDALIWVVLHLDQQYHVNLPSGRRFDIVAYYADDRDVMAWCAAHKGTHLATLGIGFVRRLVKISQRLADAILPLDLKQPSAVAQRGPLTRDEVLGQLLSGDVEVSRAEALEIVAGWPAADTRAAQLPLGAFALFYDLLRLVWLHEWAHALCGHAALAHKELGLLRLHEFAAEREGQDVVEGLGFPRHEVMQALELHADEFATRYCVGELLWGHDPVGDLAGPDINLVERLVIFNLACCVFGVMWASAEQRYQPGMSFYPKRAPLDSDESEALYALYPTSHPPAALRYMRFREFQGDLAMQYAMRNPGATTLGVAIDSPSRLVLYELAKLDPRFYRLLADTPGISKTPEAKRLIAYEAHLLKIGAALRPGLEQAAFLPTADPRAE